MLWRRRGREKGRTRGEVEIGRCRKRGKLEGQRDRARGRESWRRVRRKTRKSGRKEQEESGCKDINNGGGGRKGPSFAFPLYSPLSLSLSPLSVLRIPIWRLAPAAPPMSTSLPAKDGTILCNRICPNQLLRHLSFPMSCSLHL